MTRYDYKPSWKLYNFNSKFNHEFNKSPVFKADHVSGYPNNSTDNRKRNSTPSLTATGILKVHAVPLVQRKVQSNKRYFHGNENEHKLYEANANASPLQRLQLHVRPVRIQVRLGLIGIKRTAWYDTRACTRVYNKG